MIRSFSKNYRSILISILVAWPNFIAEGSPGDTHYLEVRSSKLRSEPTHWAKPLLDLNYGDALTELTAERSWIKVRSTNGVEGYLHSSALTQRRVILPKSTTALPVATDNSSIVLAGKGFNKDIESSYFDKDKTLNYQAVDKLESIKPTRLEILELLKDGDLNTEPPDQNKED